MAEAKLTGDEINALRDIELEAWKQQEHAADLMVPLIGHLYRQCNVIMVLFGKGLVHKNSIDIIRAHNFVCKYVGKRMQPTDSEIVLSALTQYAPNARDMRIDLGRTFLMVEDLVRDVQSETSEEGKDAKVKIIGALLNDKMAHITPPLSPMGGIVSMTKPSDVVLYGFGRIGRLLARLLIEKSGPGVKLMLRAIVVRSGTKEDLAKRASLLRRDSVHGPFNGTIQFNEEANAIIANGNLIQIIYANAPDQCDYTKYGIHDAVVIDNTGIWRDKDALGLHLKSPGVSKVILTAPAKGNVPTIVAGVNNHHITAEDSIYSAASCTTNAIAPSLLALDQKYGIIGGHIETVHSFTNDQNLIDNYHMKERRGRSAVLNMVITETGAAAAVVKCLPSLKDKLTANAIRVPTPNVSLAILNVHLDPTKAHGITAKEINSYMSKISLNSPLQNQIDFVDSAEVASSDFVGSRASGTVDGKATIVKDNKVILYVWYDNEFGYSCQVVRLLQSLQGINHPRFPDQSHVEEIDRALNLTWNLMPTRSCEEPKKHHAVRPVAAATREVASSKQDGVVRPTSTARMFDTRIEVGERTKENESLRRELGSLRGVERENVSLLQSFRLLEERLRNLDEIRHEKRQELKAMHEKVSAVEAQRDHLHMQIEEIKREHQDRADAFKSKQFDMIDRIKSWNATASLSRTNNGAWKTTGRNKRTKRAKICSLSSRNADRSWSLHARRTNDWDCDRVLSNTKKQQQSSKASYHDQLQFNGQLKEQVQRLESQAAAFQYSLESEKSHYEESIFELEAKLTKRKNRIEMTQVALHEKDKQIDASQRENALRDRNSAHIDELNHDLKKWEKPLTSEVSELQIALGDVTDEKNILHEKILALQGIGRGGQRHDSSSLRSFATKKQVELCLTLHNSLRR
ncbi:Glyceraldehyde-3-phosphate dehydrogenase, type i, partial [Globisporangium splendens]